MYNGLLSGTSDNISSESAQLVKNKRLLYGIIEEECEFDPEKIDKQLEKYSIE
jgi:ATP-dependent protease ClpP protease subunit